MEIEQATAAVGQVEARENQSATGSEKLIWPMKTIVVRVGSMR
jgi:hypothetical protein